MPIAPDLPLPNQEPDTSPTPKKADPTVSLLRQKIDNLYQKEPPAKEEEQEIEDLGAQSRHQQFIEKLMNSGKNMAQIQTAWHNYYQTLSDPEKKQVWQEFYENHARQSKMLHKIPKAEKVETPTPEIVKQAKPAKQVIGHFEEPGAKSASKQTVAQLKKQILHKVSAGGKLQKKHHIQSVVFGLGIGMIVLLIFMFGFFNERIVAPLISPSKNISNTPIIVDPVAGNMVGPESKIIIPKINLEIPVVYGVSSIKEDPLNAALEKGVVHYPITPVPGQNGNVVIVGHSSNNIFNRGRYKFAFVLLNRLQNGDTFMLNYKGQRYVYKVFDKKIVKPTDVSVLGPTDRQATATLITCDPPGTAMNRLVVVGEQISPEIAKNSTPAENVELVEETAPQTVPGNPTSLFQRLFGWIWD